MKKSKGSFTLWGNPVFYAIKVLTNVCFRTILRKSENGLYGGLPMEDYKRTKKNLVEYNGIIKENDELYRNAAKSVGLSDCSFWILYCLRDSAMEPTQSEICTAMYQPKQTVNSAIKKLEGSGYIELSSGKDNRSKRLRLTERGEALAAKTVDRVIGIELDALGGLSYDEQETFLKLFRRFTEHLKQGMQRLEAMD